MQDPHLPLTLQESSRCPSALTSPVASAYLKHFSCLSSHTSRLLSVSSFNSIRSCKSAPFLLCSHFLQCLRCTRRCSTTTCIQSSNETWTMAVTDTSDVPEICVKSQQQQDQTKQSAKAFQPQALPAEFTTAILAERGVSELMKAVSITAIPEYYLHPESVKLRQQSESMADSDIAESCLPVIDLAASRADLVRDIGKACGLGFFQIINHGICPDLIEKISAESKKFFSLPLDEKIRCSTAQKVAGPIHFGGGSKGDWRDVLKINIEPASAVAMDYWPVHPLGFRETLLEYVDQNKALVKGLLGIISESLGLETEYIDNDCGEDARVLMAINHYPPCPDPSLTMGIRQHSDPNTITILLQDQVAGLQMHKDGQWFAVKALENSLIVNAGDHLQILSNGRYPSCLHRVVTNKLYPRTSVALFYSPSHSACIKPAPALVDEERPAQYCEFVYGQYLKNFYQNGGPNNKVILGQFESEAKNKQ